MRKSLKYTNFLNKLEYKKVIKKEELNTKEVEKI